MLNTNQGYLKQFVFFSFCLLLTINSLVQLVESQPQNGFGKLTTIGRGWVRNLIWNQNTDLITVTTDSGTWEYTHDLQEISYSPASLSSVEKNSSLLLSPDQTKTAFIQENYQIEIQDNHGKTLAVIPPVTNLAHHPEILWHPNSQQILRHNYNSSYGGLFQVWNTETGVLEKEFYPGGDTYDVSFSPDGKYLAIAPNGIYDAITYEKIFDFGSLSPLKNIWSPSSNFIALNSYDYSTREGTISILDVQSQQVIKTLIGQVGFVLKIVWSLDETQIISLDGNQTIAMWDIAKGQQTAMVIRLC